MNNLMDLPKVSVVIVNYNGLDFIVHCLKSVLDSYYPDFEIILVDNASVDTSLTLIENSFSYEQRLKIIKNACNIGPAKARNIGIRHSTGRYVVFLDNDTEVDKCCLRELVKVFENDSTIGAAQCKLLLLDKKTIDGCGHYLSIIGFPYEVGVGEFDRGQYDIMFNILGSRSAAMAIRKDRLDRIEYFDESYFIYSEDTDLCWRVWLNGQRVVYIPQAIVYHIKGGTLKNETRHLVFYEGAKNCTRTLIKNLGLLRLLIILPLHILSWFILFILFLFKNRFVDAKAILKGLFWNVKNIKQTIKLRKNIQVKRAVSDRQIIPIIMGSRGIFSLFEAGLKWIRRI